MPMKKRIFARELSVSVSVSDDENVNPKPMTSSLSLAIPIYYQHSVNIDQFIEMVDS